MSLQNRNYNILIGDGTAVPAGAGAITTVANGDLAVVGRDMKTLTAGDDITDSDVIYIAQGLASGVFLSMPIYGRNVTKFQAESFRPGNKQVNTIGYSRLTSSGSINVLDETEYALAIILKGDKTLWSQRQLKRPYNYTTSATATQQEIAENIAALIVADAYAGVTVIVVGNGTGGQTTGTVKGQTVTYQDITGATAFGLEITGVDPEFNTLNFYEKEFFSTFLHSGFTTATANVVAQAFSLGSGTYNQVYFMESIAQGFKGVSNRRGFPVPSPTFFASSTGVLTDVTQTVTATQNDDEVTFSADVTGATPYLQAGDVITITGVEYEIKYFISTTAAVLTTKYAGVTGGGKAVKVKEFYDLIVIEHSEVYSGESLEKLREATVTTVIAVPSGIAGSTATTSQQGTDLVALLNPYMLSTPGALANISL